MYFGTTCDSSKSCALFLKELVDFTPANVSAIGHKSLTFSALYFGEDICPKMMLFDRNRKIWICVFSFTGPYKACTSFLQYSAASCQYCVSSCFFIVAPFDLLCAERIIERLKHMEYRVAHRQFLSQYNFILVYKIYYVASPIS